MISGRDEATRVETAGEIREATGAEVNHHATDLTRVDDVRALVGRMAERFGGVDVLVSNAGGPPAGSFDAVSDEDWCGAFELNLMSVVRLVWETLPHMRERGFGRIVNVASSFIRQHIENLILSNTFRAGVVGLAKSLSFELAPDGILVNTLGPGCILHRAIRGHRRGAGREPRGFSRGGSRRGGGADTARSLRDAGGAREGRRVSGLPGGRRSMEVETA